MWRYLVGAVAAALLMVGGIALWDSLGKRPQILPAAPLEAAEPTALAEPPAASEKTREEKRFARYDKDKDGKVSREEFLASRRKAYAKLDANGDGRLSFEEWSLKTTDRFAKADGDKNAILTAEEFATTRIARKAAKPAPCVPESEG